MDHDMSATAHDFTLVPGKPGAYRLAGTVTTSSTGWTVEIHELSDGIVPDPAIARFLVHVLPPTDDIVIEYVVTDHPVEEIFEEAAELTTAYVHLQGATNPDGGTDIEVPLT